MNRIQKDIEGEQDQQPKNQAPGEKWGFGKRHLWRFHDQPAINGGGGGEAAGF